MRRVFPWVLLAIAAYAVNVYLTRLSFDTELFAFAGTRTGFTVSHAIIASAIVLLFAELVLAASNFGVATDVSHALCGLAWGGSLVLFTALPEFRTPTFALTLLCLSVDLFAGIWITIRLASKHLSVDQTLL